MKGLRGLRGQLALAFALVFGLAVGLAGLVQYRQVGRVLHQADDQRLRTRAQALLDQVDLGGTVPVVPLPGHGELARLTVEAPGQPAQELFRSPGLAADEAGQRGVAVRRTTTNYAGRTVQVRLWLGHSAAPLQADLRRAQLVGGGGQEVVLQLGPGL